MNAWKIATAAFASLALTLSLAPAARAEAAKEDVPASYAKMMRMQPKDAMHMMDADGNGYVTREEFMKFQEALFDKIDRDGDRRLAVAEFTDQG